MKTTEDIKEWATWCGYGVSEKNEKPYGFYITYPNKTSEISRIALSPTAFPKSYQISGNAIRFIWIEVDGKVYVDSWVFGKKPYLIKNRIELKHILNNK